MARYAPLSVTEGDEFSPPHARRHHHSKRRNLVFCVFIFVIFLTLWFNLPGFSFLGRDGKSPQIPIGDKDPTMGERRHVLTGYFVSWGIYGRDYKVSDVDVSKLTHILYAFANLRENGEVFLGDPWADIEKHFDGDSWNDVGTNLYGNFKQLGLLKKRHRHLKVSLSIGGYTWSVNFAGVAADPAKRKIFVSSSIALLNDLGLDGLDVDWEYPNNHQEAVNFVKLLGELRHALDDYARSKNETEKYLLTAAMPCGEDKYQIMLLDEMNRFLDLFYLMAYDYAGEWSPRVGHQSNLYGGQVSTDKATRYFLSRGVSPEKIVIGMPLYGRAFKKTNGIGHTFEGVGEGTWEKGIHDFKRLPRPGATEYFDAKAVASWSFDPKAREVISYDTADVVKLKCDYIREKGFGGSMFWELSADHPTSHERSLVSAAYYGLGGNAGRMDTSPNHLSFPDSKYDNVRNGYQ